MTSRIEGFLGRSVEGKKSRIPALQDKLQSATGLIMACFMLCHMIFTGTILFGENAFEAVVAFAEPGGIHIITNIVAFVILIVFMIHAFTAMRKFPANYAAYKAFKAHKIRMNHLDTTLWWFQFLTGFLLFFLASMHILTIAFGEKIDAWLSIDRFHQLHLFYFVLLIVTVTHACIGSYRLYVKWYSISDNPVREKALRQKVRTIVFVVWGLFLLWSLIADVKWLSL